MKETETDLQLKEAFRKTLPEAPISPWFTRKVLNRLPERQRNLAARIEMWICVAGLAATIWLGGRFVAETLHSPVIRISDIIMYGIYLAIFAGLVANLGNVIWQRSIRHIIHRRNGIARMQ